MLLLFLFFIFTTHRKGVLEISLLCAIYICLYLYTCCIYAYACHAYIFILVRMLIVFMLYAPLHTLAVYMLGACCRCSINVLSIFSIRVCVIYIHTVILLCTFCALCIVYICCIYGCCINVVFMFYTCFICNVPHAELARYTVSLTPLSKKKHLLSKLTINLG